jgi:hypothetical protein
LIIPILAIAMGFIGLGICVAAFLGLRDKPERIPDIPGNQVNAEVNLRKYRQTQHPFLFVDRELEVHPFKIGASEIFCGDCLIRAAFKKPVIHLMIHSHDCTVKKRVWKVLVCLDEFTTEYYISLEKVHFRKK